MSYYDTHTLTLAEGNKLAASATDQQTLQSAVDDAVNLLRSLALDCDISDSRAIWDRMRRAGLSEADQRSIQRTLTQAIRYRGHLQNLEYARTQRRPDYFGNEYTISDVVVWPVSSGSSAATIRAGRVMEIRNNGGVQIMPLSGRWGGDPKPCTVKNVGHIICVTAVANIQEDTP